MTLDQVTVWFNEARAAIRPNDDGSPVESNSVHDESDSKNRFVSKQSRWNQKMSSEGEMNAAWALTNTSEPAFQCLNHSR